MAKLYPGIYSPWLKSYDDVREMYRTMPRAAQIAGKPLTQEDYDEMRRSARVVYRQPAHDPLRNPLIAGWRTHYDDNGETGVDYRLLRDYPDDPWTAEDIERYVYESEVYLGRGRYDFDCSGERFTRSWDYRYTPAGIVLLHYWGTDI